MAPRPLFAPVGSPLYSTLSPGCARPQSAPQPESLLGGHLQCSYALIEYSLGPPLSRTTSTEQCARAAVAAETLPSLNRSKRLRPLAPTKIQSAPQLAASAGRMLLGSPFLICEKRSDRRLAAWRPQPRSSRVSRRARLLSDQ